jgi:two-component system response regulator RegA
METQAVHTVLLVDDDEWQLDKWEREFVAAGWTVYRATNREDARRIAEHARPNVAIVDLLLGNQLGYVVVEDLKACDRDMFVLLVSAALTVAAAMAGVRAGASDCFVKPVLARQVIARVEDGVTLEPDPQIRKLCDFEWEHVDRVLHDFRHNVTHAADALGIHRQSLQRKIRKHTRRALPLRRGRGDVANGRARPPKIKRARRSPRRTRASNDS